MLRNHSDQMTFYQSIADYYEEIFPFNSVQTDFVRAAFPVAEKTSVLDIGCGTGSLSIALSKDFSEVTAIDLDSAMIKKAMEKKSAKAAFKTLNMLHVEKEFGPQSFDAVLCFGNTLVHLDSLNRILDFFTQSKKILKENGKLLFQIINYDRIVEKGIKALPTLENDKVRFVRNYRYNHEKNRINFETILTIRKSGRRIENSIQLYPLRQSEIEALLKEAGFSKWQFYGNFKRGKLTGDSIPFVAEAS
ncbi:MAG: methyltransferase domain-containing protein [Bacteroidales bacterium]|nr:methyltransferase domain-containing protein [Bacteroidales bacterium]